MPPLPSSSSSSPSSPPPMPLSVSSVAAAVASLNSAAARNAAPPPLHSAGSMPLSRSPIFSASSSSSSPSVPPFVSRAATAATINDGHAPISPPSTLAASTAAAAAASLTSSSSTSSPSLQPSPPATLPASNVATAKQPASLAVSARPPPTAASSSPRSETALSSPSTSNSSSQPPSASSSSIPSSSPSIPSSTALSAYPLSPARSSPPPSSLPATASPVSPSTSPAPAPVPAPILAASNLCAHCKEAINDSAFIRVGNFKFHKDHFLCSVCSLNLHGQKFHQREGKFYCESDFSSLFCQTCRECNLKISGGKMISAFGFFYHPACFTCHECHSSFDHGKYYERDLHPYCELHFPSPTLLSCAACHLPVKPLDSIKANDLLYHAACLSCYHCGCDPSLAGSTYVKDSKMFCKNDYLELYSHRCTQCAQHIMKQCISVNDEYYHPTCLTCDFTGCALALDKYICVNGHLRCNEHADHASVNEPFTCAMCKLPIDDETSDPVRCVGKKLHAACFKCSRCASPGDKKSMTLRDDTMVCMPCLIKEGVHFQESLAAAAASSSSQDANGNRLRVDTAKNKNGADSHDDDSGRNESKTPDSDGGNRRNNSSSSSSSGRPASKSTAGASPAFLSAPVVNQKIDWKKGELIGKGSFGKVYMGMNIGTGELIAVKQVRLNTTEELEQATAIQNEIRLMENLRHPNIVAFLGTQRHGNKLNILMEFVPGKSLDFLLDKFGALYETVIRSYTKQLLLALDYCHSNGVVHRDLKGKNILIDTKGNLKLADFGSAKKFENVLTSEAPSLNYNYTPLWTAPEVLTSDYNSKVDLWSLGCCVIEMAAAKPPWSEQNFENPFRALWHIGNSNSIPAIPKSLSEQGQDFVRRCLTRDPNMRPTADEMLKHPWIADLDVQQSEDTDNAHGGEFDAADDGSDDGGDD